MKSLICIAPDGEFVEEGSFQDVETAWDRSSDMGSRWWFYPIHVVAGGRSRSSRLAGIPEGMPDEWLGKSLGRLLDTIAADEQHACDYANGECPFEIFP